MFKEQLAKEHPNVYQVLENAIKRDRLAHAYMFVGDAMAPKKETAYLLAQSLVCDMEGFADETCDRCMRVKAGNFADMIYLDGNKSSIKKEDIIQIKKEFSKTNLESVGKKIYILDGTEHATLSALNSLLTFLEEPNTEAIAILLVENLEQVLDTIKSRCQIVTFQKQNKEKVFMKLKASYDDLDAHMLSHIGIALNDVESIYESDEFQHASYIYKGYVDRLLNNNLSAAVFLQNEGFTKGKRDNKQVLNYFLDMLYQMGRDVFVKKELSDVWYQQSLTRLNKVQGEMIMKVTNEVKDKNIKSVNLNLLVDQFIYEMEGLDE